MKKYGILLALLFAIVLLGAEQVSTRTDIQAIISQVNADSVTSKIQHLQDYQTRYALADNHLEVANWISAQFQRFGFTNTYLQDYQHQGTTQYNVIATIPGSVYPDIYIIVGGHYDSWSGNSNPMVFAPGADDNASGTSGVIEMARVMKASGFQPKCSIRFIAFSAEEGWAYGSEAYCQEATNLNQNIRLMVNLDMIANNPLNSTQFLVMPYIGSEEHSATALAIAEQYSSLQPVMGWLNEGSDSIMFWQWGYDAVFFFEHDISPWYHSSEDIIEHLDPLYCAEIIRAATAVTAVYANKPLSPTNLRVFDTGIGSSLSVAWNLSADTSVDHYRVYYGTAEDSLAFWQNVSGNQCLVTGLNEGQLYYIAVSSISSSADESVYAHSSGIPLSVPLSPLNLTDHPIFNAINLTWTPNTELDLLCYRVYRSFSPNEVGTLIATVSAPQSSYTDPDLTGTLDYYCYRISALDTQEHISSLSEPVLSRPVSLNTGILVIDESKNFSGTNPFQPTDQAVDDYYDDLLQNHAVSAHLDLETHQDSLRLADIGIYSSLLWHGNDNADQCYPYGVREALRQYISLGGNVLFSLYQPSKAFELNAGYPAVFEPNSFISEVLGISAANYSVAARFKYAVPNMAAFAYLQVDSLKTLASWNGHIFGVESIEPLIPSENVYSYGSDYPSGSPQGILNGHSVGVLHHYGAGQALTLSFPLYNMQESSSEAMINFVFSNLFNESSQVIESSVPATSGFSLLPNYPNPFSSTTMFRIETKDTHNSLQARVYNLKGQLIKELFVGIPNSSSLIGWDGSDARGTQTSSGIYFIQVRQNGETRSRKILLLRH